MKTGGGSRKGGTFERLVAKTLSLWLTGGQDRTQLIRSVSSGGWSSRHQGESWRQIGDLAPNGTAGEAFSRWWAVECKHHREIDIGWGLWRKDGGRLGRWWKHLQEELDRDGRPDQEGMLIFRANGQQITVALPWPDGTPRPALVTVWRPQLAEEALVVPWHNMALVRLSAVTAMDPQLFVGAA